MRSMSMKALQKILGLPRRSTPEFIARLKSTPGHDSMAKAISYEDLKQLIEQGTSWVFDVRSTEEVAAGCIPSSIHIPVADVEAAFRMDPADFKAKYGVEKPQPEDENLVFHCQMGKRGAQATEIAASLGYTKARNFAGGFQEWSKKEGK